MTDWCILEMSGQRTLRVVDHLLGERFTAWAPTVTERHKRRGQFKDVRTAIMPGFVFVAYSELPRLYQLMHDPRSGHPAFSIVERPEHGPASVTDHALSPLRDIEARLQHEWTAFIDAMKRGAKRKRKRTTAGAYVLGQRVQVLKPAWSGLKAEIVEKRRNGDLVLVIDGFSLPATVASCDVAPIQLNSHSTEQVAA